MDLRLGVALRAGIRGAAEYLVLVAILAADLGVAAFQGEDGGMVVCMRSTHRGNPGRRCRIFCMPPRASWSAWQAEQTSA
jgi:hypothetical protein